MEPGRFPIQRWPVDSDVPVRSGRAASGFRAASNPALWPQRAARYARDPASPVGRQGLPHRHARVNGSLRSALAPRSLRSHSGKPLTRARRRERAQGPGQVPRRPKTLPGALRRRQSGPGRLRTALVPTVGMGIALHTERRGEPLERRHTRHPASPSRRNIGPRSGPVNPSDEGPQPTGRPARARRSQASEYEMPRDAAANATCSARPEGTSPVARRRSIDAVSRATPGLSNHSRRARSCHAGSTIVSALATEPPLSPFGRRERLALCLQVCEQNRAPARRPTISAPHQSHPIRARYRSDPTPRQAPR